jgi:hypothetical protein
VGYAESPVTCPKCASRLSADAALCPRCGCPIFEEDRTFRLAFEGDTIEFAGWLLLAILSAIIVIPLAWTLAAFGRWFARNLRVDPGVNVTFTGTPVEILGWLLLSVLISLIFSLLRKEQVPLTVLLPAAVAGGCFQMFIHYSILRWVVGKIELSSGPPLHFDGTFMGYIGYRILLGLSFITVIGWAWVLSSYYSWVVEHTRGEGVVLRCEVPALDVLGRTVAAILCFIPVVTIPWACMWYTRWLVGCMTITRGVEV